MSKEANMKKTIPLGLILVAVLTALFLFGFSDRENQKSIVPYRQNG